jgi:hypothetical protein
MDKIWILKNKRSSVRKFRVYKSESDVLRDINSESNLEVLEYKLDNKKTASDFIKERDRDIQLRSILGELSENEIAHSELVSLFEELAPDGKVIKRWNQRDTTTKEIMLSKLKKFQTDKRMFVKVLVDNKKYFFTLSNEIRWYKSILKCHNFRDPIDKHWDSKEKKYIDKTDDIIKDNFSLAKLELKLKK